MASLVQCEGSAALQALVKRGKAASQGEPLQRLWPVCPPHIYMHTDRPILTQEQVEDPGGHPARAVR